MHDFIVSRHCLFYSKHDSLVMVFIIIFICQWSGGDVVQSLIFTPTTKSFDLNHRQRHRVSVSVRYVTQIKLRKNDEDANNNIEDPLPPLPPLEDSYDNFDEANEINRSNKFVAPWDEMDDYDKPRKGRNTSSITLDTNVMDQITNQRQQIQELMLLVQNQAKNISEIQYQGNAADHRSDLRPPFPNQKQTLKAMLFIDGTWLYYSLYHRGDACPIVANYGLGWQHSYKIDWGELPKLIAKELQLQLSTKGWHSNESESNLRGTHASSNQQHAAVDITRATCFTSYKASTDKNSLRVKMFDQMDAAGFDMIKMETVGKGEKCVDIALAVDMLHYATIPGSMDICILLTGDKDFIPACLRVRQKGVQLAVVSMRHGCNRALDTTSRMKDFDIIYLDQHLANLVVPQDKVIQYDKISAIEIIKAIYGFILGPQGKEHLNREGERIRRVESRELGRFLKSYRQNRTNFLNEIKTVHGGLRHFVSAYPKFFAVKSSSEMAFWVGIYVENTSIESIEEELTKQDSVAKEAKVENANLAEKTVVELKEILRSNGLTVSGKKVELIERLENFFLEQQQQTLSQFTATADVSSLDGRVINVIQDYLKACGGSTGSRDVGRYLSANSINGVSALAYIKENHGSLASFLLNRAFNHFDCTGIDDPKLYKKDGFTIASK